MTKKRLAEIEKLLSEDGFIMPDVAIATFSSILLELISHAHATCEPSDSAPAVARLEGLACRLSPSLGEVSAQLLAGYFQNTGGVDSSFQSWRENLRRKIKDSVDAAELLLDEVRERENLKEMIK